jgi:F-type H+-transporting ATPase subunit delta
MYADSADLRRLIASPAFSAEDKAKGLAAVAKKAGFQPLTAKFLGLVATNGRAGDLMGAITAFAELSAKHRGVVTAEVTSAAALTAAQLKGVSDRSRRPWARPPNFRPASIRPSWAASRCASAPACSMLRSVRSSIP